MRNRVYRRPKVVATGGTPPVLPSISSLSPSSATQYDNGFTLTVNGNNFQLGDVVYWNGVALTTTYVNSSQLTATVPVSFLYTSGSKTISVNGTSNTDTVTVAAWSVASITGVTGWWRADDIVENPAGFVQTMNARVGAFTLTQATAANRPALAASDAAFNNRPVAVRTAGVDQRLGGTTMSNLIDANTGTILMVAAIDASTSAASLFCGAGSTIGLFGGTVSLLRSQNFDGTADAATAAYTLGTVGKMEWRHTGGTLYCRFQATENAVASSTSTTGMAVAFQLFRAIAVADSGRAAEVVTMNDVLSSADRIRWGNYCQDRYAITP